MPVAGAATLSVAGVAALTHEHDARSPHALHEAAVSLPMANDASGHPVTRDNDLRPPLPARAEAKVTGTQYATAKLEVHTDASATSVVIAHVKDGDTVDVTGVSKHGWQQIVLRGAARWVEADEVTPDKPLSSAACASGSAVERGLQPDTVRVHRAVCAQFPEITTYGGLAARGEHATGRAIDIMVSSDLGYQIAAFCQAHWRELGISQVIWRQHIWTVQRSGDGWRAMPDRGSPTANHMNHVHITTYGDQGTA